MVSVNGELLCDFVMDWLMEMVKWLVVVRVMERVGSWVGSQVPRESMTNCYTCCEPQKKLETILKTRKWRFLTTSGLFGKRLHWIAWDCLALDWIGLEPRGMFLSRRYPKILMWILGNAGRAKMKEWTHLTERGVPTRGETGHYAPLQPATLQHETFSRVPLHTHTLTHTDTHWHTHTRAGPKDSHDPPLGRQQK